MPDSLPFLDSFVNAALPLLEEGTSFPSFSKGLKKRGVKTPVPFEFDEAMERLESLRKALLIVYSIVLNPAIKSTVESSVSRSEFIGSLDPSSFIQTMKEPSFWREKDGEMAPEYVHYEENTDTIVRYENLFVWRLVNLIDEDARRIQNEIVPFFPSFESVSERRGLGFGPKGPLAFLDDQSLPYQGFFAVSPSDIAKADALAKKVRKMVKNVKGTEFYRLLAKERPIMEDIIPTNILLHDPAYNRLYKFYEDHYRYRSSLENGALDVFYYDYAVYEIFSALARRGIDLSKLRLRKDPSSSRLRFSPLSFEEGPFAFKLEEEEDALAVVLTSTLAQRGRAPLEGRYRIYFAKDLDEDNEKAVRASLHDEGSVFDDTFLVVMSDAARSYDRALAISYYDPDNLSKVDRLFRAASLLFEADPSVFEDRCPVCGAPHPTYGASNSACEKCQSRFVLLGKGKKGRLWIKALRRPDLLRRKTHGE